MAYIDIAQQTEARELIVGQRDNHMNETVIIHCQRKHPKRANCVLFVLFPFLLIILFTLFILLPIIYTCLILWHFIRETLEVIDHWQNTHCAMLNHTHQRMGHCYYSLGAHCHSRDPETGSDVWLLLAIATSWRHDDGDQHKGDCTTSCCQFWGPLLYNPCSDKTFSYEIKLVENVNYIAQFIRQYTHYEL